MFKQKSWCFFTRNTAHICSGNNSRVSSDLRSNVSKVYSASIVRECDAVLFSYGSWDFFLFGSWVQTQVESPPKMSEIFYDLPCKKFIQTSKKLFWRGRTPSTDLWKDETTSVEQEVYCFRIKNRSLFLRLVSSCGGTEGY